MMEAALILLSVSVAAHAALVPILWWRYFLQEARLRRVERAIRQLDKVVSVTLETMGVREEE